MLDIVKANGSDPVTGLVDETIKAHPELTLAAARTIKGRMYKTLVRTSLGNTSGSFRQAGKGVAPIKHTYENRLVETFIMSPRFECDKAVADSSEDGPQVFIARENEGTMEGESQALAKQFYYGAGTGGNADGHPGLIQSYDATNMVVDAGGTTAATGSSCWLVCFGDKDVQWVFGQNGQFKMSPVREESLTDPDDATKKFPGYVSDMSAYPGLQVGSLFSCVRIKKLTADAGKGMSDALIALALAKYPAGKQPDVILVSRRSISQWQQSRITATNPAPAFPTEVPGLNGTMIPIRVTDAISDTESLTL
jgi:hypothetical protein